MASRTNDQYGRQRAGGHFDLRDSRPKTAGHGAIVLISLVVALLALASLRSTNPAGAATVSQGVDYPVFGFDPSRSGLNPHETTLAALNVARLVRKWHIVLPQAADSTAIEIADVPGRHGRPTLFITTLRGTTLAVDEATGKLVWTFQGAQLSALQGFQITNATPAADPSHAWIYASSPDGKIHKLAAATGQEAAGWPIAVTLHPQDEKIGSALNIIGRTLLVTTGGYVGDFGHYEGHLVAIDTVTRSVHVFNTLCSGTSALLSETAGGTRYCASVMSGVWARGGAVVDLAAGSPTKGSFYIASGNGPFNGTTNWSDSVLRLGLGDDGSIQLQDSYTPANYQELQDTDGDLGSTTPILLPQQSGSHPWLALQGGKDSRLRLVDRANMSDKSGPGHVGGELATIRIPLKAGVMLSMGIATIDKQAGTLIYIPGANGITALKLSVRGGPPQLTTSWSRGGQATTPALANGVLYVAGSNLVQALNPATGGVLWQSTAKSAGGTIGGVHWQSPTVVNSMVIMPDSDGGLSAYGLS
jgi:outer membrane protein assembly factor BamB